MDRDCVKCGEWLEWPKTVCTECGWNNEITPPSMNGKILRFRCEACRGRGKQQAGEGHEFDCLECQGKGHTETVFKLFTPLPTLREQLEQKEQEAND